MGLPFAKRFVTHCNNVAQEIAQSIIEDIHSRGVKKSEREKFIAFVLADELQHFYYATLKLQVADPDGRKLLNKIAATRVARIGGAKRTNKSLKLKFLQWALAENARNPELSKNSLAEVYARRNSGTSVATLRRYLSDIPRVGVGDD